MKVFIVLSVIVACAFAKPTTVFTGVPLAYAAAPVAIAAPLAVSSQFHAQDELGQYNYGYSSGLSSKVESKSLDGVTRGGYSYVDGDGKVQNVEYTADAVHGFRVAATNLPVAPAAAASVEVAVPKPVEDTPEVAEAKAKHMVALKEAEARAIAADVQVVAPVPVVAPVAAPVAAVKLAAPTAVLPSGFSYGYAAHTPAYTAYANWGPVAYSAPIAYGSPFAYSAFPYNYVNVVPQKIEEVKA